MWNHWFWVSHTITVKKTHTFANLKYETNSILNLITTGYGKATKDQRIYREADASYNDIINIDLAIQ